MPARQARPQAPPRDVRPERSQRLEKAVRPERALGSSAPFGSAPGEELMSGRTTVVPFRGTDRREEEFQSSARPLSSPAAAQSALVSEASESFVWFRTVNDVLPDGHVPRSVPASMPAREAITLMESGGLFTASGLRRKARSGGIFAPWVRSHGRPWARQVRRPGSVAGRGVHRRAADVRSAQGGIRKPPRRARQVRVGGHQWTRRLRRHPNPDGRDSIPRAGHRRVPRPPTG